MAVKLEALKFHTYNNHAYDVGDVYEADDSVASSICGQGMAKPVDEPPPPPKKASKPVEPMTTDNSGLAPGK